MTHVEAIRAELVADAVVAALVEDAPGVHRIYPLVAPDGCGEPFVILAVISDVPENSLDGTAADRLRHVRMQVDCYAPGYIQAHELAEAIDNVLSALQRADLSAERSSLEDDFDDETQLHRVAMDFDIWR